MSNALITKEIIGSSVPDLNGSPLNVSVVITYKVVDTIKALYNVKRYNSYLESQAMEVVRRVVSYYKYRSNEESEPTLLNDSM